MKTLLTMAFFLWTGAASAALKVSLITISPGPVIFESFGHVAVAVQDAEKPGKVMVYEYGNVNPARVFANPDPMAAFSDLFSSKVKTRAGKLSSSLDETSPVPTMIRVRYLSRPEVLRQVTTDELSLTEAQAAKLVELMEQDIAGGEYYYENFKNNCSTKVRDRLFDDAVLGKEAREKVLEMKVNASMQQVSMQLIDQAAIMSATKSVTLMPPALAKSAKGRQALMILGMLRIPSQFSSSKEFYDALKAADQQIALMMGDTPFATLFHDYFFGAPMLENPISLYQAGFAPDYLRAMLVDVVNPATGKPVIDKKSAHVSLTPAAPANP
jgi:hypothetical protein